MKVAKLPADFRVTRCAGALMALAVIAGPMAGGVYGQFEVRTNQVSPGWGTVPHPVPPPEPVRPQPLPVIRPWPVQPGPIWPCPPEPPRPCPPGHDWHGHWPGHGYRPGVVYGYSTGSGLTVRGNYNSGNWNVGFNVGSDVGDRLMWGSGGRPIVCVPAKVWPYYRVRSDWYDTGWVWTARGWRWYRTSTRAIDGGPSSFYSSSSAPGMILDPEEARRQNAAAQQQAGGADVPEEDPGALARALVAFHLDDAAEAASQLRAHLKEEPGDHQAMRLLALAHLHTASFEDAVSMMSLAYKSDPGLATTPIDVEMIGLDKARLRGILTRTVSYAHKNDRGAAWLTVAALMQAEGRVKPALNMIAKARKTGYEAGVCDAMEAALGR